MKLITIALLSIVFTFGTVLIVPPAHSVIEAQVFDSVELEERYAKLIKEFRCLVCQNQNLADSDAELAQDLREKTAELLRAGQSDSQIRAFMQERYGDFVLYRTPIKRSTVFIWIGPIVALLLGLIFFFRSLLRKSREAQTTTEVDNPNLMQAKKLLNRDQ